jgi:hypothetical protein
VNWGTLAAVVTIAVAVTGGVSTLIGQWLARRAASGRVATSEAAILWQQSQDIRTMLLTEKTRAEDQRDKLIDAYTGKVLPTLAEINKAVAGIAAALEESNRLLQDVRVSVGGGTHEAPEAPGGGAYADSSRP